MTNITRLFLTSTLLVASLQAADKPQAPKMPPPKADVYIVPQAQDLAINLKYPAEVVASKKVQVVSRVIGILEKKYFKEGDLVKEGDLLYKIEDRIYKAKVDSAIASVKMSEVTLDNATRNWERVEKLYKQKAVSDEKKDASLFAYEQALASLALAQANLNQVKIDLDYTQVKAPISGKIGLKKVDVGDLVSSNPPTPLVEITQNDKVYVDFSMPLSDYINIKNKIWQISHESNLSVSLEVDDKEIKTKGFVDFIDTNIDKQTSVVKLRAVIDNKDGYLMAGSFVRVKLEDIVQKNVITIPQKAVLQNNMGTIVFIENNSHVDVRPVVLGKESGDKYVVAGGPLKSGDKVFVNNFFRLKPGGEVVVDKTINE